MGGGSPVTFTSWDRDPSPLVTPSWQVLSGQCFLGGLSREGSSPAWSRASWDKDPACPPPPLTRELTETQLETISALLLRRWSAIINCNQFILCSFNNLPVVKIYFQMDIKHVKFGSCVSCTILFFIGLRPQLLFYRHIYWRPYRPPREGAKIIISCNVNWTFTLLIFYIHLTRKQKLK